MNTKNEDCVLYFLDNSDHRRFYFQLYQLVKNKIN